MAEISGGDRLDKALGDIARRLGRSGSVRVGFLSNARYPTGESVALIASIQEFGAPSVGIPPRPFFRNMIAAKSGEWPEAIRLNLVATGYDVDKTLARVGEGIAGQLRQSIIDTNSPPLKPATIARKGFSKPLIDEAIMINSVDFETSTGARSTSKYGYAGTRRGK
jgi:hypothetical protein